ncbi:MAG: isomerase [Cyclobacteriaceae bacterium]|nr:isomerase [Cyclobacteriaceae bacterium]
MANARTGKDAYTLNFPCDEFKEIELTEALIKTSNSIPKAAYRGKSDVMLVFEDQQEVEQLLPQLDAIKKVDARGLIVTAQGKDCDFVSRFFAPAFGIDEDPVTGSAHTTLVPYWAKRLGKVEMEAVQVSARSGKLHCNLVKDRVELTGKAVLYLKGEMYL